MDISRKLRLRFLAWTAVSAHFRKHFRHNIGHVLQKTNKQTNKRPDRQKAKLIEKKRLNCPFGCVYKRKRFLVDVLFFKARQSAPECNLLTQ